MQAEEHKFPFPVSIPTTQRTAISKEARKLSQHSKPNVRSQPRTTELEWNTFNGLYQSIAKGILEFSEAIFHNLKAVEANKEHTGEKVDPVFLRFVQQAIQDCETFSKELVLIKDRHKTKEGQLVTNDEMEEYYALGEAYYSFFERFKTIAFQASVEITAYLSSEVTNVDENQNLQNLVANATNTISSITTT